MTNEPASGGPPITESKSAEGSTKTGTSKPDVEYDDFGLPIRKPRPRTPLVDSDSEGDNFEDAVAKPAAQAKDALPEESTRSTVQRKEPQHKPGTIVVQGNIEPAINGRIKEKVAKLRATSASRERKLEQKPGTIIVQGNEEPAIDGRVSEKAAIILEKHKANAEVTPQGTPEKRRGRTNTMNTANGVIEEKEEEEGIVSEDTANAKGGVEKSEVDIKPPTKILETPKDEGGKPTTAEAETASSAQPSDLTNKRNSAIAGDTRSHQPVVLSEYSHQQLAPETHIDEEADQKKDEEDEWQTMPAYARYDMYDDDNRLVAKENLEELEDMSGYGNVGGAAKGYSRVTMDDDAESQTSMDDNTAYLFKERGNTLYEEDEAARDPLAQMQTTKSLLTEGQRIAYVGLVRLGMAGMVKKTTELERTKGTKKIVEMLEETTRMWSQKMMVRLYTHMEVDANEQIMIEQLAEHGVIPSDLSPTLMQNARVKNPAAEDEADDKAGSSRQSVASPRPASLKSLHRSSSSLGKDKLYDEAPETPPPPPYKEHDGEDMPEVQIPSQLPSTKNIDIDIRWTILCDLFLVLIADSVYDSRSRQLLEEVGKYLSVDWLELCRFEKRVTDALEMQEDASKENWNEDTHMESRRKLARNRRIALMGLATVGGSLVIGLSAGLMAPVIGAGLAAGFTTIGVAGTGGFLAGVGGAAVITTTGVLSGGTIAVRAANRRTGSVRTFEYRPLHNNKRVNLIVTIAGWMNGKVDDVRLPYSTVDPIMGDMYSVLWEPEMLRSMGDTINILATEALTQGLQQVLGSTILIALMAALQLPVALTKLAYLIDNPWTVSQTRADMAGLILADSLIDRNLGSRPITLVGFSLGARVIFSCLRELAKRGAFGIVQNAYMFGIPVVAKKDEFIKAKSVVPGRFVNGYATNDWILGYLFRATSGGIMRVAGLAPVLIPGVENIDVTELVPGHMAYRAAMPKLLREVGWIVESDEFTEIEDPDPENHEQRQRELINEIEEARKELEKKPEKKGFAFWRKKKVEKKEWEVYDENSKASVDKNGETVGENGNPVMFDIDAIRAEVAALSTEDQNMESIEIKEIKSTLPPMKIDMNAAVPASAPYGNLRETKSYNDSLTPSPSRLGAGSNVSTSSINNHRSPSPSNGGFEEYNELEDGLTMTFDDSFKSPPASFSFAIPRASTTPARQRSVSPHFPTPLPSWDDTPAERPALKSHATEPKTNLSPGYNAWADDDEDEFGHEKEMKMTFE